MIRTNIKGRHVLACVSDVTPDVMWCAAPNERAPCTAALVSRVNMADIPVVSLFGDEKEVIRKLDAAFRDVGFVFVVHHSILPHQVRLVSRCLARPPASIMALRM